MEIKGLSNKEANKRLEEYGRNEIQRFKKINPLKIFLSQFTSPLIAILIAAAFISLVIGYLPGAEPDIIDAVLILIIVIVSGISGFFQEYKAEKSIEILQKMASPKAWVIREGQPKEISSAEIVVGDIILLESGNIIPADAKLLESFNLKVDESTLTGESRDIAKKSSDQVFMNTSVYVGNAKAAVTNTGMQTKMGKIARKLQEIKKEKTLFEIEISKFSKRIFWIVGIITIIIFLISLFKYSLYISLLTAISLAVAAIPEGLPAIVVLALAIGARVMLKKNSLIRKLSVAESIGAIDVICTDKTGTITKNEMTVSKFYINDKVFETEKVSKDEIDEAKNLIICGALCNNTRIELNKQKKGKYLGEQTEIALLKFAERFGFSKEILEKNYTRINEEPFTAERKMMSTVLKVKNSSRYLVFSKGAPELLIEKCGRIYKNGKIIELNESAKKKILDQNKKFAGRALRVLGFAFKKTENPKENLESNLIWIGLQAMIDPPHPEVKSVLKKCKTAGIRVIMMTGDNPNTARAIADEINLETKGSLTGKDLDELSQEDLRGKLDSGLNIFARINPFHKLRILKIMEKTNRVVMTGDGVNDSLALKQAHVGIAMGLNGTQVAKEASDMVLLDDNFASIITAVKEGRRIFANIRKSINYLLISNLAEVGVLLLATLFIITKEPILLPVQILWINLLTDGLPALALGVDPAKKDIMSEPPRKRKEAIINKRLAWLITTIGFKKIIVLLATFFLVLPLGIEAARTALFTGFILYEFVRIGSIRHQEKLTWFSNKWLIGALTVSVLLQLLIIYSPLNKFFHIVSLGLYEWMIILAGVFVGYITAIAITKSVMKFVKE